MIKSILSLAVAATLSLIAGLSAAEENAPATNPTYAVVVNGKQLAPATAISVDGIQMLLAGSTALAGCGNNGCAVTVYVNDKPVPATVVSKVGEYLTALTVDVELQALPLATRTAKGEATTCKVVSPDVAPQCRSTEITGVTLATVPVLLTSSDFKGGSGGAPLIANGSIAGVMIGGLETKDGTKTIALPATTIAKLLAAK